MFFENRAHAGQRLVDVLREQKRDLHGYSVLGIARGGVTVGAEIASAFGLPLRAFCVDDFTVPEGRLLVTSVGSGALISFDGEKKEFVTQFASDVRHLPVADADVHLTAVLQRTAMFNSGRPLLTTDRILLCDDGLVSGETAFLGAQALKANGVRSILLAIPVVPKWFPDEPKDFEFVTWRVTTMKKPTSGIFYYSFPDVPDADVISAVHSCAGVLTL